VKSAIEKVRGLMEAAIDDFVRAAYPRGTAVTAVESYRSGYLPFPARVTLALPDGREDSCVVKLGEDIGRIQHEGRVLAALAELGLPVPALLAGPAVLEHADPPAAALAISVLPGEPLPWIDLTDLATANRTCRLLLEGIEQLHALTTAVEAHPVAAHLPRRTLQGELAALLSAEGAWRDEPLALQGVAYLQRTLPRVAAPLVFSNGDYNPLNFLHIDGRLSGFIDFEHACFEDPLLGFAKFVVWAYDDWGWGAGQKAGLVERALYRRNATRAQFLPRLVLRCLQSLPAEDAVPQDGRDSPRAATLRVLAESLAQASDLEDGDVL
jgi:aminoglycoside phosphotransferase (APT) family kinase protein